jgi:hypothetical protein
MDRRSSTLLVTEIVRRHRGTSEPPGSSPGTRTTSMSPALVWAWISTVRAPTGGWAAAFQSELGHDVAYIDVPPEAFGQNLRGFGLPDSQITDIFALFDVVTAGYAATVTADVAQLRGRAPRTIADFAHDYRALFS